MNISTIINQVAILFIIMVIGFYARKRNFINNEISKGFGDLLLNITLPAMIIASFNFNFSKAMMYNVMRVFLVSFVIHTAAVFIGKLIYGRYPDRIKSVLRFTVVFSNCAFMGFPVLEGLYGKEGVFYGSIYLTSFNIFLWTIGTMLFTGEKNIKSIKNVIINPGILSVAAGILLFIFSIKLPFPIQRALEMVGGMTTPISMLVVGAMLAGMRVKDIFSGFAVYYGTFVRLIAMPVVTLILLKLLGFTDVLLGVCVVTTAMPAAANTAIFAEKYGGDAEFASQCVFITTILSIVTIPLVMMFV